ncbi:phage tail sheath C-terminal domain-containing protein [[Clostridium] colinum]|uniref:phage tail sheath C-terminal domain-containing protein n=1 Tax=[Clostridium] colinum TaxID=36835 RepID=UPI0020249060|nr:phage tail sheath C-terminal domain-containing protein [[Clostridium] colinum]
MHIVNFANKSVTKTDGTIVVGYEYLGRLLGVLAGCRMDMSVTYTVLTDLKNVQEIGDTDKINEAIGKGKLVLINDDDGVRISRGVNSLQTNDKNHTEDMKYIAIVEAMDLIYEDIINTFKKVYLGRFKNSYDNQVLFISAVNSYFRDLAREEILDPNYNNSTFVDIEKQREIWISNGKIEAQNWSDIEVKNNTFRTNVYLQANVKFLNAMEDLLFVVNM